MVKRVIKAIKSSLKWKVTLGVALPLLLILGVFTAVDHAHLTKVMLNNLSLLASQSGMLVEENLRQQMVAVDFAGMQQMLNTISASQQFHNVYLLNPTGKVIFAPYQKDVGLQLNKQQTDCWACHRLPAERRPVSVIVQAADGVRVFRTMQPIENDPTCNRCHDPAQAIIGLLMIDVPTASFEAAVAGQLRDHLYWWIITIAATIGVVNLTLSRLVLSRVEGYSTILRTMTGQQSLPTLPADSEDELGKLAEAFNQMARQVEARRLENTALAAKLTQQNEQRGELVKRLIEAQEEERKRVARELHDQLGQSLGGLALKAAAAQRFLRAAPERASEQLEQIRNLADEATNEMHDLILALRPSVLDDLGLAAALRTTAARSLGAVGIQYTLDSQLNERLPQEIELAVYRIFQEALNNVVRHSGATQVEIELKKNEQGFEGNLKDNGQGFDPAEVALNGQERRGLGLLGMQERIAQCDGTLHIERRAGGGTTISIFIPLAGRQ